MKNTFGWVIVCNHINVQDATTITMSKRNVKKSYDRILEISEDAKQITMPDSRYYRRNGKYYPSVTYVLSSYPKGKHFEDWLKKMGTYMNVLYI